MISCCWQCRTLTFASHWSTAAQERHSRSTARSSKHLAQRPCSKLHDKSENKKHIVSVYYYLHFISIEVATCNCSTEQRNYRFRVSSVARRLVAGNGVLYEHGNKNTNKANTCRIKTSKTSLGFPKWTCYEAKISTRTMQYVQILSWKGMSALWSKNWTIVQIAAKLNSAVLLNMWDTFDMDHNGIMDKSETAAILKKIRDYLVKDVTRLQKAADFSGKVWGNITHHTTAIPLEEATRLGKSMQSLLQNMPIVKTANALSDGMDIDKVYTLGIIIEGYRLYRTVR